MMQGVSGGLALAGGVLPSGDAGEMRLWSLQLQPAGLAAATDIVSGQFPLLPAPKVELAFGRKIHRHRQETRQRWDGSSSSSSPGHRPARLRGKREMATGPNEDQD